MSSISCSFHLEGLLNRKLVAVQLLFCGVFLLGFVQQLAAFFFHLPSNFFSMCFLSIHGVHHFFVLTQLQHGRNSILSYWVDHVSIWSLSCQWHSIPLLGCMLTSLSVHEMLLLRYVNESINFKGLPLRVKMPFLFKTQVHSFFYIHRESSVSFCLLQAIQFRFCLVCKKP